MRYLLLLYSLIVIVSCSNTDDTEVIENIFNSEYFPLEQGHTNVYQVEEIVFDQRRQSREIQTFQLKEEIIDNFEDNTGNTVFTIDRYTRLDENDSWSYQNSWQAMIIANQAIRIEENRSYIKLQFPAIQNDEWDGNALFDDTEPIVISGDPIDYYKNWSSKLLSTNSSETVGGLSFSDAYKVSLADYENKLEVRTGLEIYAKGRGLIYREIMVLDTQCFDECSSSSWEEKAENGHIYIQTILN